MENFVKFLKEKDIDLEKLSKHSGVPLDFLKNLSEDNSKSLPPYPYARAYLLRLAKCLNLNKEMVYEQLKKWNLKTSGEKDKLPGNRFKLVHSLKKRWLMVFIFLIILVFSFYFFKSTTGLFVHFENPKLNSQNFILTGASYLNLTGKTCPNCLLYVNGSKVLIDTKGHFKKNISLEPGLNTLNIKLENLFGRGKEIVKRIFVK